MTTSEHASFVAGLAFAADMARTAALSVEARPDHHEMRQRAVAEALRGLAEGIMEMMTPTQGMGEITIPSVKDSLTVEPAAAEEPDHSTWGRKMAADEMVDPFAGLSPSRRLVWERLYEDRDLKGVSSTDTPSPVRQALALIADIPGASGEIECPRCAGQIRWVRSSVNGHVSGGCETEGCLSWMQ